MMFSMKILLIYMVNQMMPEEEFYNTDTNYSILMEELKQKLINLQLDLQNIRDPEVKGYTERIYTKLKIEYFRLLKDYTSLVVLSRDLEETDDEQIGE